MYEAYVSLISAVQMLHLSNSYTPNIVMVYMAMACRLRSYTLVVMASVVSVYVVMARAYAST